MLSSNIKQKIRKITSILLTLSILSIPINIVYANEKTDNTQYTVTLHQPENGILSFVGKSSTLTAMSYNAKQMISFYAAVENQDYILDDIIVVTASGEEIDIEHNDFAWEFMMPDENVEVYASFKKWDKNLTLEDKIEQNYPNVIEENDTIIPSNEYILTNIDVQYAKANKLEPIDILYVKNTLIDTNYLIDIDKTFDNKNTLNNSVLGQTDTCIFLYNTDDNSDYYVAYANQMQNDVNSIVKDYKFAYTNNDGEIIDDAIFDYKTGLAYVPKSYQLENKNGYGAMNVQLQLLQEITSEVPMNTINVFVETNSRVKGCVAASGVITFDSVCENIEFLLAKDDKAKKSIKEDYINVDLNANGVNTDNFTYNEDTGILTIEATPLCVNEIIVKIEKPSHIYEENIEDFIHGKKPDKNIDNYVNSSKWNVSNIQVGDIISLIGTMSYIDTKDIQDVNYYLPIGNTADNGPKLWQDFKEMNNDCLNTVEFSELKNDMYFNITIPGGTYNYDESTINIPTSSFIVKSTDVNTNVSTGLCIYNIEVNLHVLAIDENQIYVGLTTDKNTPSVSGIYVLRNNVIKYIN